MDTLRYITMGFVQYEVIPSEDPLPKNAEWCKNCQKQTAVPIAVIDFNGKKGYALQCRHCRNKYPIYKEHYDRKYLGFTSRLGKYVPPNPDGKLHISDRAKKEAYESSLGVIMNFGHTREEAVELKKQWKEQDKADRARFNIEQQVRYIEYDQRKQDERTQAIKEGMASGKIIWNSRAGSLVNKETGELVKL